MKLEVTTNRFLQDKENRYLGQPLHQEMTRPWYTFNEDRSQHSQIQEVKRQ